MAQEMTAVDAVKDFEGLGTFIKEVIFSTAIIGLILGIWYVLAGSIPTTYSFWGIEISHLHSLWCGPILVVFYYAIGWPEKIISTVLCDGPDWETWGDALSHTCFKIMSISFILSGLVMIPYGVLGSFVFLVGAFICTFVILFRRN